MYTMQAYYCWLEEDAIGFFRRDHGDAKIINVSQRYPGVNPTQCLNDDRKVKGARTWISQYYIYQCNEIKKDPITGENIYIGMRLAGSSEAKLDAVKQAKEFTLANQLPHTVRIVKVLTDSNIVSNHWVKNGNTPCWDILYCEGLLDSELINESDKISLNPSVKSGDHSTNINARLEYNAMTWLNNNAPVVVSKIEGAKVTLAGNNSIFDINWLCKFIEPIDIPEDEQDEEDDFEFDGFWNDEETA